MQSIFTSRKAKVASRKSWNNTTYIAAESKTKGALSVNRSLSLTNTNSLTLNSPMADLWFAVSEDTHTLSPVREQNEVNSALFPINSFNFSCSSWDLTSTGVIQCWQFSATDPDRSGDKLSCSFGRGLSWTELSWRNGGGRSGWIRDASIWVDAQGVCSQEVHCSAGRHSGLYRCVHVKSLDRFCSSLEIDAVFIECLLF